MDLEDSTAILYHGTSSIFLESILKRGLLPRKYTGISNWDDCDTWLDRSSHPDLVYLASTPEKARNIGARAVDIHKGRVIVLKVKVNAKDLKPDEDAGIRIWQTGTWQESLRNISTCSHCGPIPPENISIYHSTLKKNVA